MKHIQAKDELTVDAAQSSPIQDATQCLMSLCLHLLHAVDFSNGTRLDQVDELTQIHA